MPKFLRRTLALQKMAHGDFRTTTTSLLSRQFAAAIGIVMLCPVLSAQTFRATVDQVAIPVTIQGGRSDAVPDLERGDFRVFDEGQAVEIVAFERLRQPLHVLLLLDTSRSMMQSLSEVAAAADAVIRQLASDDTFQIGTFSNSLRLSPPFSADDAHLATRVSIAPGANMTVLYDALVEGCSVFAGEGRRRAIFVVSDGTDTASSASARTVMQRAAETNVSIHAVGIRGRYAERGKPIARAPDPVLRDIAEDTGGAYVDGGAARDFSSVFARMIEELRREYLLGFTPVRADGRIHSITVTTRRPEVKVRARKQYRAPVAVNRRPISRQPHGGKGARRTAQYIRRPLAHRVGLHDAFRDIPPRDDNQRVDHDHARVVPGFLRRGHDPSRRF